jgi:hypothetical protein
MEDFRANENETIQKTLSYDVFPNQVVSMEEEPLTKTMEKNTSL